MPAIASTFKSGEPSLPDILKDINDGKVQLPDFQRGLYDLKFYYQCAVMVF